MVSKAKSSGKKRSLIVIPEEINEDLSLGLYVDDRDDSVLGGGWSDEEEDDLTTPR